MKNCVDSLIMLCSLWAVWTSAIGGFWAFWSLQAPMYYPTECCLYSRVWATIFPRSLNLRSVLYDNKIFTGCLIWSCCMRMKQVRLLSHINTIAQHGKIQSVSVVAFSSLASIWGECLAVHSPPVLFSSFFFEVEISWHALIPLFRPGCPSLCLDSGIVSPLWLCWVKGVCMFRCNLPPAFLAEWPGHFTCNCGNTYGGGTDTG